MLAYESKRGWLEEGLVWPCFKAFYIVSFRFLAKSLFQLQPQSQTDNAHSAPLALVGF